PIPCVPPVTSAGCPSAPARSRANLQPRDSIALKPEYELKFDRTAGELSSQATCDHRLAVLLDGGEGLYSVVIFLFRFRLPSLDSRQAFHRAAFVLHDGILREAMSQGRDVVSVLGGDISCDGRGEIERHDFTFSFVVTPAWR